MIFNTKIRIYDNQNKKTYSDYSNHLKPQSNNFYMNKLIKTIPKYQKYIRFTV